MTRQHAPRSFVFLTVLMLVAMSIVGFMTIRAFPTPQSPALLLLAVSAAISENFSLEVPGYSFSLAYPLMVSALLLGGPLGAGLVAAASGFIISDFRSDKPISRSLYNFGQVVFISCTSGWLYLSVGGRVLQPAGLQSLPLTSGDFPAILMPMAVVAVFCALGNVLFTALGASALYGRSLSELLRSLMWFVPSLLALATVGFLIAQVLAVRLLAFPLFVFPLFLAREMYQRYEGLKSAYVDTVRSLIGALEAKDPYTKGHSERVAEYAVFLGARAGLDSSHLQRVEYAALLHDLGKLAVPDLLLIKPDTLTAEELAIIREHPGRGADMVERIPLLKDLSEYVLKHHERFGGGGYPSGVGSEQLPMGARILAIADSFDAMTTNRAYRPALSETAAMRELEQCAGLQFDPQLVELFVASRSSVAAEDPYMEVSVSRSGVPGQLADPRLEESV